MDSQLRETRQLYWEEAITIINIAKKMIDLGEYQPFIAKAVWKVMIGHDTLLNLFYLWDETEDIHKKKEIALAMDSYLMY